MKIVLFLLLFLMQHYFGIAQQIQFHLNIGLFDSNNGKHKWYPYYIDTLFRIDKTVGNFGVFSNTGQVKSYIPSGGIIIVVNGLCSRYHPVILFDEREVIRNPITKYLVVYDDAALHPIKVQWRIAAPVRVTYLLELYILPSEIYKDSLNDYKNHPLTMHIRMKTNQNYFSSIELNIPYKPGKYEVRGHKRDFYRREITPRKWKTVKRFKIKCDENKDDKKKTMKN